MLMGSTGCIVEHKEPCLPGQSLRAPLPLRQHPGLCRPLPRLHPTFPGSLRRRFLNRLLGLPVSRQNLLFNYFSVRAASLMQPPQPGTAGCTSSAAAQPAG